MSTSVQSRRRWDYTPYGFLGAFTITVLLAACVLWAGCLLWWMSGSNGADKTNQFSQILFGLTLLCAVLGIPTSFGFLWHASSGAAGWFARIYGALVMAGFCMVVIAAVMTLMGQLHWTDLFPKV